MKKLLMCSCTALVFLVAAAVAQTSSPTYPATPSAQGTQGSSPSMGQQGATSDPAAQGSMSQGSMSGDSTNSTMKADKTKMKGCIQSLGGQYLLQTKKGKDVILTGQDVSAHVGHEVTVHGTWEAAGGNTSGMSDTASANASPSGKSFNVTGVDMISDTCTAGKAMSNDKNSGTGAGTTPPQK
jgi:hypothetical protein